MAKPKVPIRTTDEISFDMILEVRDGSGRCQRVFRVIGEPIIHQCRLHQRAESTLRVVDTHTGETLVLILDYYRVVPSGTPPMKSSSRLKLYRTS